jgi:glycosyltransferase involved in cell wall biosynthesis
MLARSLADRGARVTVCGPAATLGALGDVGSAHRVAAAVGRLGPGGVVSSRRALRRAAVGAGVVHAHGLRAGATAATAGLDLPLVTTWHNAWTGSEPGRLAYERLARAVARRADLTLAASPDLAAAARRAGAREVRTTFVVAPPLGPATRPAAQTRAELGVGDRPMVLAVARLHAQKRLDVLVDAAAGWGSSPGAPTVVVAGDGPEREALAARIERSRAPVTLLGARDDVADLLHAADVVAVSSAWEARALIAQEALRAGVPLVATAVGGLPELVGDAAVLVPPGDPAAFRWALEQAATDPLLRARLVAAGPDRAATWPDADAMIDELVTTYLALQRRP